MPLPITDASFGDMESMLSVLTEEEREGFKPIAGNLKRGEASFHHPLTVHGSCANRLGLSVSVIYIHNYTNMQVRY